MKAAFRIRTLAIVVVSLIVVMAGYLTLRPGGLADAGSTGAVRHLGPAAAHEILRNDPQAVLVDVRTPAEFRAGHLKGAINVELDRLEAMAGQALPDKDAHLVVYCRSGNRSSFAVSVLERMGYSNLVNVTGGIVEWAQEGLPVARD